MSILACNYVTNYLEFGNIIKSKTEMQNKLLKRLEANTYRPHVFCLIFASSMLLELTHHAMKVLKQGLKVMGSKFMTVNRHVKTCQSKLNSETFFLLCARILQAFIFIHSLYNIH